MEPVLVCSIFLLVTAGVYLLLQTSLVRVLLGVGLISHAVHLLILCAGRLGSLPPLMGTGANAETMSAPLPQALVLTSIVISMAITVYLLAAMAAGARHGMRDRVVPPPERDAAQSGEEVLAELEGRRQGS
jgi:multicomponent Na+:H+ antiporter subunit C